MSTSFLLFSLSALSGGTAHAQGWGDFASAFPAFPCHDGWMACLVDDDRLDPVLGEAPADLRVSWFEVAPTTAFSPFSDFSAYGSIGTAEAPPEPVPAPPAAPQGTSQPPRPQPPSPQPPSPQPPAAGAGAPPAPVGRPTPKALQPTTPPTGGTPDVVPTPEPSEPPSPQPPPKPSGGAHDPSDGSAMIPTPEPPPAQPPPAPDHTPSTPEGCDELHQLEPAAMLGRLDPAQIACLEGRIASERVMTDKKKVSLVLLANAWASGDRRAWEDLVKRHLDEIDRSDPNLCYKYALYLSKAGSGRAPGVIRWSEVALENRTVWTGDTYTSRVNSLYRLRAKASQDLWKRAEKDHASAPTDETRRQTTRYQELTKVNAREWYEYARSAGKDPTVALQLCRSAAGTSDYCGG